MLDPPWTGVPLNEDMIKGYDDKIKAYDDKIKGHDDMRPR